METKTPTETTEKKFNSVPCMVAHLLNESTSLHSISG